MQGTTGAPPFPSLPPPSLMRTHRTIRPSHHWEQGRNNESLRCREVYLVEPQLTDVLQSLRGLRGTGSAHTQDFIPNVESHILHATLSCRPTLSSSPGCCANASTKQTALHCTDMKQAHVSRDSLHCCSEKKCDCSTVGHSYLGSIAKLGQVRICKVGALTKQADNLCNAKQNLQSYQCSTNRLHDPHGKVAQATP